MFCRNSATANFPASVSGTLCRSAANRQGTPVSPEARTLINKVAALDVQTAIEVLDQRDIAEVAQVLAALPPGRANSILSAMSDETRSQVLEAAPGNTDWMDGLRYPEGSVGRLLEDPPAVFRTGTSVATAIDVLRDTIRQQRTLAYLFVVDARNRLIGVTAFRELLYAERHQSLDEVMRREPFFLRPEMTLTQAMREVVARHYPAYPVCERDGTLVGQVRGQTLFEQQNFETSAQAGAVAGVERQERLASPLLRSFKFRQPWLQIHLMTVFVTAAVIAMFQDTIGKLVLLAVFLPVLGNQSANLGSQSLALMLRGMSLSELDDLEIARLIGKEALLGLINGLIVGALAAVAMYIVAGRHPENGSPLHLSAITWLAMTASCMVAGVAGSTIPLLLKRLGADPAMASGIILTTVVDVFSIGTFLGLVTAWVL